MFQRLSLALVLAVTACGGGNKPSTATPSTTPTATPTKNEASLLELGELKIVDVHKNKAVLIHADGSIELDGQKPATVHADGTVVAADGSTTIATLAPNGSIKGPDGAELGYVLSADGVLTNGDKKITIDETGMVQGGNPGSPPLKIEGASTANLKRTALVVLVAMVGNVQLPPPPPPTGRIPAN